MNPLLITSLTIGAIGLVCGATLAVAARYLSVEEDPRIEKILDLLPGANCGGCGFAGCADYAKAVIVDGADVNLCAPGGDTTLNALAGIMGVDAVATEKKVALVLCRGDDDQATRRFKYNGIADCKAAQAVGGGDKSCTWGCLGYGSCSRVCPVGAIEITHKKIAVVHPDLCIGCGACVSECPREIITMVPVSKSVHVMCSSRDKGPVVKKACKVGCIGCTLCAKLAENEAIKMDGFLAVVDYTRELENEKVVEKCPGKCIVRQKMT